MRLSPAQINEEIERVRQRQYRRFLAKIRLFHIRGFRDQAVEFRYPVTALIGTNGGGKSTILGAAALAYKDTKPGTFFPKASIGDDSMAEWRMECELLDRDIQQDQIINRTARFAQLKWRRDGFPSRNIIYIEIQRTVPAGEVSRFKKFLGNNPEDIKIEPIANDTVTYASAILGRDIQQYRLARMLDNPAHSMYVCESQAAGYSQFHFGAGEASIISTIDRIENAPNNSLVLIEEMENGLHPAAVRSFSHYLMNVARRKRLQIIFTTHSQAAIDEMPPESIWACINARTFNGSLTVDSLRAVTGFIPTRLVVFVEDEFAADWVRDAIGRFAPNIIESVTIHTAGGYPNVVRVTQFHNQNPERQQKAICLVDGDMFNPDDAVQLPDFGHFIGGGVPESAVFEYIFEKRHELASQIRQRCLITAFEQDRIVQEIERAWQGAHDHHTLFRVLGDALNFQSEIIIRRGLINIFNEYNPEFWRDVVAFVVEAHPDAPDDDAADGVIQH